ncbi:MAG: hypothetical protein J7L15_08605, partial [Clostridiales bacterium]|nr:hypothetical protein [Clostridiales bacterium]
MNWFNRLYKDSWGSIYPTNEDPDKKKRDPYKPDPNSLTTPNPWFGGDIKGDIAVDPANRREDLPDYEKEVPPGRTILDDDIGQGEGANDNRFVSDEDKIPIDKKKHPIGPHNMQSFLNTDVFDFVSKRTKTKNINK